MAPCRGTGDRALVRQAVAAYESACGTYVPCLERYRKRVDIGGIHQ